MGWFNIQQLKEPTAIQAVANGAGALGSALGAVTDKLGSIYNAERDRKYQMEKDAKNYEQKQKEIDAKVGTEGAKAKYYEQHGNYYDNKGAIDAFNAKSQDRKRQSDMAVSWANHGETKRHHLTSEDIQRAKTGGGNSKAGNGGKKILQREIDENFNSKKYSQNINDLLNTEF